MFNFKMKRGFLRTTGDKIAFCAFILGGHLCLWYETQLVVPFYHQETNWLVIMHYLVAGIIYISAYANLYRLITTDITGRDQVFPSTSPPDWRYCDRCFDNYPPRSHHCKACDLCVLKRDHHCWFSGTCIGYANHRYYIIMMLYMWFGALYGNIFNWNFVRHELEGFGIGTWLCIVFPHAGALFGYLTAYQFLIAVMTEVGLMALILFTWLLQMQLAQAYHGQTRYERKKNNAEYNLGFVENLQDILGANWYLAWVFPWLPSKLPGDGVNFKKKIR